MTDYSDLRKLAEAATPGEWRYWWDKEQWIIDNKQDEVIVNNVEYHDAYESDIAYIAAANPARVLALLDELERKTAALKVVRNSLSMLPKLNGPANVTLTRIAMTVGNALQDRPE